MAPAEAVEQQLSECSKSQASAEDREGVCRHYVAYKTQTNFVDLVPQKRRLLLTLKMRFDELSDPRGLAADITNLGLWSNGDVQMERGSGGAGGGIAGLKFTSEQ